MKNIYIASTHPNVGKTTFSLALALRLRKEGKNVGYFKPIKDRRDDEDAEHAKQLLGMAEDPSVICPAVVTEFEYDMSDAQVEEVRKKIKDAYVKVRENYDFLIIESCRTMNYLSFLKLSSRELVEMLDAKVLFLVSGKSEQEIDAFLLGLSYFNDLHLPILGGVLTLVPSQLEERFRTKILPVLTDQHGIDIFGVIPKKQVLIAPTVGEVAEALQARVLAGKEYMHKLVEDYQVGAMEEESALKFFRKATNQAVITGGDRPSLAVAAMETCCLACVIFTGELYPPASVLARAEDKQVPILLVGGDTYSVVSELTTRPIQGLLHPDQTKKLDSWSEIMDTIDYAKFVDQL